MFELFLNPWYAVAGLALISVPIIIHLINRMRFKRIRWAAMEFLLKSQKKNRRRLIIEQLLLLALRCFLVVLAGFLIARFLGFSAFGFFQPQNTTHVVLLDDTLSMSDRWREQGEVKNSFDAAKGLVRDIAKSAARAGSAQQMKVILLTDPKPPRFENRLNDESIRELASKLDDLKATPLHVNPLEGVKAAQEIFAQGVQDQRVLHIVSDFRSRDWSGQEANELQNVIETLAKGGVKIYMIDAAHPYRGDGKQTPLYHDNLGILDLRPETRIAPEGMPVQFTVAVANFSTVEKKNVVLHVFVDGKERLEAQPVPIMSLPPGYTKVNFLVGFVRPGFNQVSVTLEDEEAGLQADNKRFAVIEVRKQVPVLVVDGDPTVGQKPAGDTYHLQTVFSAARGYQVVPRGVDELERPTLDQYPCIYLLNVPQLRSEKGLKNLEDYVQNGGSVAFFMGDKVKPDYYNKSLYKNGKGVFPAPLADRPTQGLTDDEKLQKLFEGQFQLYLRGEHFASADDFPIFGQVSTGGIRNIFKYLIIDKYLPVPRLRWNREPGQVDEFATLPNNRSIDEYKDEAQRLLGLLPINEEKYAKYKPGLEEHQRAVRSALGGKFAYELANVFDALLHDRGDPNDPKKPNLVEFWDMPEQKALRTDVERFKETVQYGDPLVLSQKFGRGRVVAFFTTAGKAWTDWPGGSPASVTYPVVMLELHKYLTAGGGDNELTVGSPLTLDVDAGRYDPKMRGFFLPEIMDTKEGVEAEKKAGLRDLGEQPGVFTGGKLSFTFTAGREPGVYLFDLYPRVEGNPSPPPEQRAYVFNVDTATEGDLKRAGREDLEKNPVSGKATQIASPGNLPSLDQKQTDLSESPWFYLAILLVLVIEQALAVHLSFHLKGSEATLPVGARTAATAA